MRLHRTLPLLAAAALAACTTWRQQPLPHGPDPVAGRVRVTRTNGERMVLTAVQVHDDSLYGNRADVATHPRVAVPVAEVARVERARLNPAAPAAVALVAAAEFYHCCLRVHTVAEEPATP
jgi:hypothetical protein